MDIKKDMQGGTSPVRGREGSQRLPASNGMESFSISLGKKGERLATALYLVTSFLPDSEPLKGRLRSLSLDLVRDASRVRYGTISSETNVLEELRANISETLGLLELALIAGLISEMNFSILKREYTSLRSTIEVKKASRESRTDTVLGDTFFGSSFNENNLTESASSLHSRSELAGTPVYPRSGLGYSRDQTFMHSAPASSQGHSIGQKETTMSDTKTKGHTKPQRSELAGTPEGRTFMYPAPSVTQDARRTRILKLIKDNREVTIKDIATYFPELSEKTIQRELVSLVEANVLKKFGERRWSRYTLA